MQATATKATNDGFNDYKDYFKGGLLSLDNDLERIPTHSVALNKILDGGLVPGKIVEVYGHDGSGKSTMALNLLAFCASRYPDQCVVYFDTEGGICSKQYLRQIGLDSNNVLVIDGAARQALFDDVFYIQRKRQCQIMVIDSVATIIGDDDDDETLGQHARYMNKNLRKFIHYTSLYNSPTILILVNQLRSKINDLWKGERMFTTTGGKSLKYFCSLRLELDRDVFITDRDTRIGFYANVKVVKSRLSTPHKQCKIPMLYGVGHSREIELIDFLVESGTIVKKNNWYFYDDGEQKLSFNGKLELLRRLQGDKHLMERFTIYCK